MVSVYLPYLQATIVENHTSIKSSVKLGGKGGGKEEALNRTSGEISRANLTYAVPSPFTREGSLIYSMEYDLIIYKLEHVHF